MGEKIDIVIITETKKETERYYGFEEAHYDL